MFHQTKHINKETEIIKRNEIKILERKSTITERRKIIRGNDQHVWGDRRKKQHTYNRSVKMVESDEQKEKK